MERNKSFSFARLTAVINRELRGNWRTLWMEFGVMAGLILGLTLMIGYNNVDYNTYGGDPLNFDPSVNDEGFMGMFLLMVFGSLSASKMLSCLSTKELRLSSLMLPASQLEKYLARWIIYIPGMFVAFAVAFYLSDLIRFVVFAGFVSPEQYPMQLFSLGEYFDVGQNGYMRLTNYFSVYMVVCSFFALGSAVWPSKSFIKTFVAGFIIALVYGTIITTTVSLFNSADIPSRAGFISTDEVTIHPWHVWLIAAAVAIFNYVLAYARMREEEIIQRW